MSNNAAALFENLYKYSKASSNPSTKKRIDESINRIDEKDETLLSVNLEIPKKIDIDPNEVDVSLGLTDIDDMVDPLDGFDPIDEIDIEPEDDKKKSDSKEDNKDDKKSDKKEEPKDDKKSDKKDDKKEEPEDDKKKESMVARRRQIREARRAQLENKKTQKCDCGKKDCEICNPPKKDDKKKSDSKEDNKKGSKKESRKSKKSESILRLDNNSLNKLVTEFVKANYKNIDKVMITRAMLEHNTNTLNLYGRIISGDKVVEKIHLINKGFSKAKCEGKRFALDFNDVKNTFNIVKENHKAPFHCVATLREGVLAFEELKYNYKTTIKEGKVAQVYGKTSLKG